MRDLAVMALTLFPPPSLLAVRYDPAGSARWGFIVTIIASAQRRLEVPPAIQRNRRNGNKRPQLLPFLPKI